MAAMQRMQSSDLVCCLNSCLSKSVFFCVCVCSRVEIARRMLENFHTAELSVETEPGHWIRGGSSQHKQEQLTQTLKLTTTIHDHKHLNSCLYFFLCVYARVEIARMMMENSHITELNLESNDIYEQGIELMAEVLNKNKSLKILKLTNQKRYPSHVAKVCTIFKKTHSFWLQLQRTAPPIEALSVWI